MTVGAGDRRGDKSRGGEPLAAPCVAGGVPRRTAGAGIVGHSAGTAIRRRGVMAGALLSTLPRLGRAADCPALPPPHHGPIFDAAVQAWNPQVQGLLDALPGSGVRRVAWFADSHAGREVTAYVVQAAARAHPDLVVLGAPKIGFIRGGDLPPGYVADTITGVRSGLYRFIGEILYSHADKPDNRPTPGGVVYVDPLALGTARLLAGIKDHSVPLMTHWEAWNWQRDLPRFDQLYATWPQQIFVLSSLAYGSPDKADRLLSAHPNLWATISHVVDGRYRFVDPAKQAMLGPPMIDDCGTLRPDWRAVLLKYADRLMFASDAHPTGHVGWDVYPHIIGRYRRIAAQLPPAVAQRISWDNAASLYGMR